MGAALACVALATTCRTSSSGLGPAPGGRLTHGVEVGEVTETSAVFWGRCEGADTFHVGLEGGLDGAVAVTAARDFTGVVPVAGLTPNRSHDYIAWCGPEPGPPPAAARVESGRFHTAPRGNDFSPVRFAWGGDVGGQNACRDAARGYEIFDRLRERSVHFFIALGDMIYADVACLETGRYGNAQVPGPPASQANASSFWEHWRYNRADLALQRFLREASSYAVWDDHEIVNDAGPHHDEAAYAPGESRMEPARQAFLDYQPIAARDPLYRRFRWGAHLELFLLDTRSYRDPNWADDDKKEPKTLLGAEQRTWLVDGVAHSNATWKIVVSSVPIAIPTGGVFTDGWADFDRNQGFERELLDILHAWHEAGVENLVFITTDVHFATGFRYTPFPGFSFLEFVSGPLSAGLFPKQEFDDSLRPERLYFHAPAGAASIAGLDEALRWFNFGEMEIDANGVLAVRIVNGKGDVVFDASYSPAP